PMFMSMYSSPNPRCWVRCRRRRFWACVSAAASPGVPCESGAPSSAPRDRREPLAWLADADVLLTRYRHEVGPKPPPGPPPAAPPPAGNPAPTVPGAVEPAEEIGS